MSLLLFTMLGITLMQFIAFPQRKDALLAKSVASKEKINIESSGSYGLFYNGKCQRTYPNETVNFNREIDWCSNIGKDKNDKPWISFNLENKVMKITGYAVRNGCCSYCCCSLETGSDEYCCCRLYSYSLLGSNDNKTWKVLHRVENDTSFYYCLYKTFEVENNEKFAFIRFTLDEQWHGCPFCFQINQIELYGEASPRDQQFINGEDDNEESVSIIGKIKRDE